VNVKINRQGGAKGRRKKEGESKNIKTKRENGGTQEENAANTNREGRGRIKEEK